MDDLSKVLPHEVTERAALVGGEWLLPYPEALDAITAATAHGIAVLGVESFEKRGDELHVLDYSGYEFSPSGDWRQFVEINNGAAAGFVESHAVGENHGYVLTSASAREFAQLELNPPGEH